MDPKQASPAAVLAIGLIIFVIKVLGVLAAFCLEHPALTTVIVITAIYGLARIIAAAGRRPAGNESRPRQTGRPTRPPAEPGIDPARLAAASFLGITPDAPREVVKRRFRALAALYHPDKHQAASAEFQRLMHERFIRLQAACEVLSRQESRQ